jgi:hypothetical protein
MEKAIEAGEKEASVFSRLFSAVMIPGYVYFIGIPFFKNFVIPMLPQAWTGYEPSVPEISTDLTGSAYEQWAYTLAKWLLWFLVIAGVCLVMIWQKQE